MSSVYGSLPRPPEDLSARARIRDAALEQFAEHGFAGATMKRIAEAAGVSVGLVQHHFGTKAALRQACDDTVIDVLRNQKLKATADESIGDPEVLAAIMRAAPPLLRYLGRALVEGSPSAGAMFEELVSGVEEFLTAQWPERFPPGDRRTRDAAALMGAFNGGAVALHPLVARRLGLEPWADIGSPRIGLAMFDVYDVVGEYLRSSVGRRMRDAIEAAAEADAGERRGPPR